MSNLSWNEIRQNAVAFAREWQDATSERSEAQTFWNEFFQVFGVKRRTIASFEAPVKSLRQTYGRIDLLWKGVLIAEHKSAHEPLDKAESQAFQYMQDLIANGRQEEVPRYVILSNFRQIVLFDLEPEGLQLDLPLWRNPANVDQIAFELPHLHEHVKDFAFFIGQRTHKFGEEDPANLKAAELMAQLHDAVAESKYEKHAVERLLVRLLFCLFAEDTGILDPNQFALFIENKTRSDGTDLGERLNALFDVLNTPESDRSPNLDEDLNAFRYINGELFAERLPFAAFTRVMRTQLLRACDFDWSRISPAIFGSLFQGIMDPKERRQIGGHYTTERDILKVIRPLFLDEFRAEFKTVMEDRRKAHRDRRLHEFWERMSGLRFLDPACGCGNFLVVAYRELRELEIEVINALYGSEGGGKFQELISGEEAKLSQVDVHQFYGIEIGEWPARIAETALWLTDHQMNSQLSVATGNFYQRIPLRAAPHIRCANALRMDWNDLLPARECSFVLGNPPFVGAKYQSAVQRSDVRLVAGRVKNSGLLDYVTMWYFRAVEYIQKTSIRCAFVSTNSISQGEQVGILWEELFRRGAKIHFAHQTFAWQSEAKGMAHVHVVIVGFGLREAAEKKIFEYGELRGEPITRAANNINPYLVEGPDVIITNRSTPICDVPEIGIGNKPIDGGFYLLTDEEKARFLKEEPGAEKFFRPWIGSDEFLNGYQRWCLWLGDANPAELARLPECRKRIEKVKEYREKSESEPTRKLASTPRRFHVENFPDDEYLVIPEVSSERRNYVPIAYLPPSTICSNLVKIIPNATRYHLGILSSAMHMAWVRQVAGRLESRYRYSAKLVYNNYPWPQKPTAANRKKVEACAQRILDVRKGFLDGLSTLADLYDPLTMPEDLLKAHRALDRAVDLCYRKEKFESDRERVEFLFDLYEQLLAPLARTERVRRKRVSWTGAR